MAYHLIDDFEDNWSNWVVEPVTDGLAAAQESTIVKIGSSSIKLRVDVSTSAYHEAGWAGPGASFDVSDETGVSSGAPTGGTMSVWIYVNNLASLDQIQFWAGSSTADLIRYGDMTVADTQLTEDTWVLIEMDLTTATVVNTPDWTAMNYVRVQTDHNAGSSDFQVYLDQLYFGPAPPPAPARYMKPQKFW